MANTGRVQDKVILLTGGAMGLGEAAAKRLIEEGGRLIITDHTGFIRCHRIDKY